jgi:hypothetical protein
MIPTLLSSMRLRSVPRANACQNLRNIIEKHPRYSIVMSIPNRPFANVSLFAFHGSETSQRINPLYQQ